MDVTLLIPEIRLLGYQEGRTSFGLIKPEGVSDPKVTREILDMVRGTGLELIAFGTFVAIPEWVDSHYFKQAGRPHFPLLHEQFVGKKVIAYAVRGDSAVSILDELNGEFRKEDRPKFPNAIRTRFMTDDCPNHLNFSHASDREDTAIIEFWKARHYLTRASWSDVR